MNDELESLIGVSLRRAKLPPAPDSLRGRAASLIAPPPSRLPTTQPPSQRTVRVLLPAAAILAVLAGLALLIPGTQPPTVVDGLPVLSVSQVLAQRAAGGLHNQPVAVGGYWSAALVAFSCPAPSGNPGALELYCSGGDYGITEYNEPIFLIGRYMQISWQAKGPHLTPFVPRDLDDRDLFGAPRDNGQQYPPVPIVVVGHFDDPRADDCRPEARQLCLDRLILDKIAYFNPGAARWPAGVPTIEPTPPPAPPTYALPAG